MAILAKESFNGYESNKEPIQRILIDCNATTSSVYHPWIWRWTVWLTSFNPNWYWFEAIAIEKRRVGGSVGAISKEVRGVLCELPWDMSEELR